MARPKAGVTFEMKRITPTGSQKILDGQNGHNRPLKIAYAQSIADAWERGEFVQTGDTIKFNREGWLIDGQHRLQAVVLYGKPVDFLVVSNVPNDAISVIDAELAKRTLADQLHLKGYRNARRLAAVVNGTWTMEKYGRPYRGGSERSTIFQGLDILERRPSLEDSTRSGEKYARGTVFTARELGVLWEIMSAIDESTALDFFDQLHGGYGEKGSPVTRLMARVNRHANTEGVQHNMKFVMGLTVIAWNATVEGRRPRSLKLGDDDPFPEINDFEVWRG